MSKLASRYFIDLTQPEIATRLLLTPHVAGVTRQSMAFLFRAAWENIERVLCRNEASDNRIT